MDNGLTQQQQICTNEEHKFPEKLLLHIIYTYTYIILYYIILYYIILYYIILYYIILYYIILYYIILYYII